MSEHKERTKRERVEERKRRKEEEKRKREGERERDPNRTVPLHERFDIQMKL